MRAIAAQSDSPNPCERGHKSIVNNARHRHWHRGLLSRGEQQTVVLESERQFEARRLKLVRGDHAAVNSIDRRREKRVCEHVQKGMRVNSELAAKRKRFAQTFDNRCEEE